ncbi:UDP-N-acetylglucosamine transferase subunit alg14 [Penicillium macrosclerotiorum]|uniref:UDP-N-acetylglucosamine transferase subunit alg14 n=1 Tax=Penicillium macrosclerotiorum TaxID=303699 RepID=UPI0025489AB7|nr:UDP-N-acetylglucosamine transferase subunit alg14 [Penicillium macrosclerotiorum]KAJ5678688.1 UDP-N-acetylglucosamine transferase subunit alg14 [Penicillium macrosclerotiorum]
MASVEQMFWGLFLQMLVPAALFCFLAPLAIFLSLFLSHNSPIPKIRHRGTPVHLLVVLGSGGHTAEMFYMLEKNLGFPAYTHRTYVVTSGDNFSAVKAAEFEARHSKEGNSYSIATIPRARRVHQSYWTAPFSTLQCFWACILVLLRRHPDLTPLPAKYPSPYPDIILSNGPAVAVCMILAAKVIRFCIFIPQWVTGRQSKPQVSRLRTVFVESWARVKKLSTSGVILLPLADKFLVQWPDLAGRRAWPGMKRTEYAGWVVL